MRWVITKWNIACFLPSASTVKLSELLSISPAIMRLLHHVHLRSRLRLLMSVFAGMVCFFALPATLGLLQRMLIGWNVLAMLYLFFLWFLMLRTVPKDIPHLARSQDESASLVLSMVSLGCLVSVMAILLELGTLKHLSGTPRTLHMLLTASTLMVSWALLPTSFAMHYAHHHYLHRTREVTPMIFPEKPDEPGYWDFLYFSFTIAVASQTADVATGTTDMRQIALLQSVISFVFNLAILGLSVNVGAGLLSG